MLARSRFNQVGPSTSLEDRIIKYVAIVIIGAVCLIIGIGLVVAIYPYGGAGLGGIILPIALIIVGIFLICWGVKGRKEDKIKVSKS